MRYGIFSDVHSNLEALQEAAKWYNHQNIDKYIFLGDIVGYGANPCETISLLKELNPTSIAGNHDWVSIGKFDINYFNPYAKEAVLWTERMLKKEQREFLHTLPLIYEEQSFICVHGSLFEPQDFNYILAPQDALLNFKIMKKKICFIGHSHCAEAYILKNDKLFYSKDIRIDLKSENKYIINVGSVGQPRDKDNRLCICIYDDSIDVVIFNRLEYNIKKAANKILNVGLPSILANRLYTGY